MAASEISSDETRVRAVIKDWAAATQAAQRELVLKNHLPDALIYDVLAPMKYEGTEAYRQSWDDWQPDAPEDGKFQLEDLEVSAGSDTAFGTAFIRCGGTMPNGHTFEDLVRATFCLRNTDDGWKIAHQHISKPIVMKDA